MTAAEQEAWDKGYQAGRHSDREPVPENPYAVKPFDPEANIELLRKAIELAEAPSSPFAGAGAEAITPFLRQGIRGIQAMQWFRPEHFQRHGVAKDALRLAAYVVQAVAS